MSKYTLKCMSWDRTNMRFMVTGEKDSSHGIISVPIRRNRASWAERRTAGVDRNAVSQHKSGAFLASSSPQSGLRRWGNGGRRDRDSR
jgi:hypothetical protein